jgi:hypothetical protein
MKLRQGQIWQQGNDFVRIVQWARLSIEYKLMESADAKSGTMHKVTKKEFCRMLKGAVLLTPDKRDLSLPSDSDAEMAAEE